MVAMCLNLKNKLINLLRKKDTQGIEGPNEDLTYNKFLEIVKIPYRPDYDSYLPKPPEKLYQDNFGDCDDKAVAFLEYLYNVGERDLYFIIANGPENFSHAYLIWNGYIYDPASKPPQYKVIQEDYEKILARNKFSGKMSRKYIGYKRMWPNQH